MPIHLQVWFSPFGENYFRCPSVDTATDILKGIVMDNTETIARAKVTDELGLSATVQGSGLKVVDGQLHIHWD